MYGGTNYKERIAAAAILIAMVGAGAFAVKQFGSDTDNRTSSEQPSRETSSSLPDGRVPPAPVQPTTASAGFEADSEGGEGEESTSTIDPPEQDWSWDHKPIDKYLTFLTPRAEEVVRSFEIDCPQPGKRIRLIDVMRAGLREGSYYKGGHLFMTVDSRGDEVRIINQARLDDGRSNTPHVVATIDQWGNLQLHGISSDGIMDQCYR